MISVRTLNVIVGLTLLTPAALSAQEPNPDRLFVRVQTTLRAQPSASAPQVAVLRPGTKLTAVDDTPPSATFVRVTSDSGQQGWVSQEAVRPWAFLVAEQQLEAFGGLEGAQAGRQGGAALAKASQCHPFNSCPITGCAVEASHKATNTRKRTVPPSSASVKHLTLQDFDQLQQQTDAKGIPQGEHLSAAERKQLAGFKVAGHTIAEGDLVSVTGFIAEDRTVRCGGAESVNCGHRNANNAPPSSPCTRTDIHVPIVGSATGKQIESVVVEPIPQGSNVKEWTPEAFMAVTDIPISARFSLYHHGRPVMLDHILVSRALLPYWQATAAHNEVLHDESVAFALDTTFPESDHAPVVAEFVFP